MSHPLVKVVFTVENNLTLNKVIAEAIGLLPKEATFRRIETIVLQLHELLAVTGDECGMAVIDQLAPPSRQCLLEQLTVSAGPA